ncbi:hypothetical protein GLAREA_05577 [Glarea lozoyensis ATCC 20868]|uniref:Myb-like DNA-binding domain-containing protein n=1 Tax=Glarea lozoyensis (strain ATCC 20868 / MF5171) TaxID=1116229 RepID=S3DGI0_GLAL2|nr:uncharacterized protein GLAREA_05577 [Glarea lozoyensis ATCC 20868]EPE36239.1 hypothetical protein GLAREA_05577 [Glarea lozoyensis ATCC 20868]
MPNDSSMNRLLYAILSEKCLKDVNWDKVANNKILENEISNGHAARMRYSRFKTQMDSSIGIVKKRRKNSPRKAKADKPIKKEKGRKNENPENSDEQQDVKHEEMERQNLEDDDESLAGGRHMVKRELKEDSNEYPSILPYTPTSQYSTPSPGMSHQRFDTLGNGLDDMTTTFTSFTEALGPDMFEPSLMEHGYTSGLGMGMGMGMAESFGTQWDEGEPRYFNEASERSLMNTGGVFVKDEAQWEEDCGH